MTDRPDRARGTVSFAEMRRGRIGLCVATQIARHVNLESAARLALAGAGVGDDAGAARVVSRDGAARRDGADRDAARRRSHLARWCDAATPANDLPIGYVLSLEGADSHRHARASRTGSRRRPARDRTGALRSGHLRAWHGRDGRHRRTRPRAAARDASGSGSSSTRRISATTVSGRRSTRSTGRSGRATPTAARSCRTTGSSRDDQIRALVERGAVIGVALDAWMMVPGLGARQEHARRARA